MHGTWNYPTSIRFGPGRLAELATACTELGMTRPLLVTDEGLASLPMVDQALAVLREGGLTPALFSRVAGNPHDGHVADGLTVLREGGHDGVVALGGGSALDAAKAIALVAHHDRPVFDFEDVGDHWRRVDVAKTVPCVAVPTTAGTGSEVGRASVIVDRATHTKRIVFHPSMLPGRVIADPALTVGLPPHLTAATGLDALSHLLEAWCAPGFHPLADGIAAEGIRLVDEHLEDAVADGADLEARAGMLAASLMGATAFQKGLGAMHGMAHVLGAHLDAHHGLLNAIVMPYVLLHNRPAIDDRLAALALQLGLEPGFEGFLDWVLALRESVGIPETLAAVGLTADRIPAFAAASVDDPSTGTNPRPMDAEGYAAIYRAALAGTLA